MKIRLPSLLDRAMLDLRNFVTRTVGPGSGAIPFCGTYIETGLEADDVSRRIVVNDPKPNSRCIAAEPSRPATDQRSCTPASDAASKDITGPDAS